MAKKPKVPKKILGFKLSKGTRKDLKKLLKMLEDQDTRAVAVSAAGGLAAYLAKRFAEHEFDKHGKKSRAALAH